MNRLIPPLLFVVALFAVTFTAGCQGGQIAAGNTVITEADVVNLITRNEPTIQAGARVATGLILKNLSAEEARQAAPTIRQVAVLLSEASSAGAVQLATVRQLAKTYIDNLSVSQTTRDVAYYATVTALNGLEFVIETQFNNATADARLRATQVLLRAASAGVIQAVDDSGIAAATQPSAAG